MFNKNSQTCLPCNTNYAYRSSYIIRSSMFNTNNSYIIAYSCNNVNIFMDYQLTKVILR